MQCSTDTVYKPYVNCPWHCCFSEKWDWDSLDQMGISNQQAHRPFIISVICWQHQRKRTHWLWTLFCNFSPSQCAESSESLCVSQTTYLLLNHQKQTCATDDMALSKLMWPKTKIYASQLIKVFMLHNILYQWSCFTGSITITLNARLIISCSLLLAVMLLVVCQSRHIFGMVTWGHPHESNILTGCS